MTVFKSATTNHRRLRVILFVILVAIALLAVAAFYWSRRHTHLPAQLTNQGWHLTFSDDFEGSTLDTTKWEATWFGEGTTMNNVQTSSHNVRVADGMVRLSLASQTSGALIHTGYQPGHYQLPVGSYIEARIRFSGDASGLYNWPAWWINSTQNYPASGEHDIAEVLDGAMTVNYHSPSGSHNQGIVPGQWTNEFHRYGLYRQAQTAMVYYDRKLVKTYHTDDDGQPLDVILTLGSGQGKTVVGEAGALYVDYVKAWKKD